MTRRFPILQTKLSIPKCDHALVRTRLVSRVGKVLRKKMAVVVAGAGYGKTTLGVQTIKNLGSDCVWYRLDPMDRSFSVFLAYLVAGIRNCVPGFGIRLESGLAAVSLAEKVRHGLLLEFLEAVETHIDRDLVIVLDDFHTVQASKEVVDALEFLLARSPARLHWVLLSRTDPALKLARYRAMGEVVDVGEADLSFLLDETRALFRGSLRIDIDDPRVKRIQDKTGGWAVGLVLFFNAFQNAARSGAKEVPFEIGSSEPLAFQYIEENIFNYQPPATREFMLRSSLLSQLDPDVYDKAFHTTGSRGILDALCAQHLLTFPDDNPRRTFRYHQLLKVFLEETLLRTHGKTEVDRLHRVIGNAMEEAGDTHWALHHYVSGGHFAEMVRIFEGMTFTDFMACPFRSITELFLKIPPRFLEEHPKLYYLGARLDSMRGDIRQSIVGFRTALSRFDAMGDSAGVLTCRKEIGLHYYLTGDMVRARDEMDRLWGKKHDDAFFPVEIGGYLILFSTLLGDMDAADAYFRRADEFFVGSNAERQLFRSYLDLCRAYRFHSTGSFRKADALNRKCLEVFSRMGVEPLLPLTRFQTALTLFFLGRSEEGCRQAELGLTLARKLGIFDAQYAWLLHALGLNRLGTGDFDGAGAAGEEAFDVFEHQHHAWGQAMVYELYGRICAARKKREDAERFFRKALGTIEGIAFPVARGGIAICLAESLVENGSREEAEALLHRYRREIAVSDFHRFYGHLLGARIDDSRGASTRALDHLRSALSLSREEGYAPWILDRIEGIAPLLLRCHAAGTMQEEIRTLLGQGGRATKDAIHCFKKTKDQRIARAADRLLATLPPEAPEPLDIRCLGAFSVSVGGRPIDGSRWKSSKAKKIFQYLALKHDQGFIPKEVLIELAWPDEDAAQTNRRFHVALSFLRRLLEPDLKRGIPSAHIIRQGDGYRLRIGREGRIDVMDFLGGLETAGRLEMSDEAMALNRYVEAIACYNGPLFEETPYEEGFSDDRDRLAARFLNALEKIIRLCEKQMAWDRCIAYAERYLSVDGYAEKIYCDLMTYYFRAGKPSRIPSVFQRCKACIVEDLGLPLQKSTEAHYRNLCGETPPPD